MVATSRVINLIFSQKYEALQVAESDPAVAIRLFLLSSKTYDWDLNVLLDTLSQNCVISVLQIFTEWLLHVPKN